MTTDTLERTHDSAAPLQTELQGAAPEGGTGHTHLALVQKTMVEFDNVAAGLAELTRKYKDVVFPVSTTVGMAEAKLARAAIRDPRIAVGKAITAGKAPLNELKRILEGKGLEIVNALVELETPIHEQIKAEEDRKAAEKQEREARAAAIAEMVQGKIDELRAVVVEAAGKTAAEIAALLDTVENYRDITLEDFGDRAGEAMQVKAASVAKLKELHASAVTAEAAAAELAAAQQQLATLRAAEEARQAEARAAEAAELAAAAERQAAERRQFEEERAAFAEEQRQAREAEAARVEAARQAETDRVAEEQRLQREADESEQARLDQVAADARAEADRIAAEARAEANRLAEAARVEAARIADEARAAEEAAQAAHQKVRNAAHTLLAALQGAIPFIGYEGAGDQEAKAAAYAAVIEATGEEA